jgi:hypothetical protein
MCSDLVLTQSFCGTADSTHEPKYAQHRHLPPAARATIAVLSRPLKDDGPSLEP